MHETPEDRVKAVYQVERLDARLLTLKQQEIEIQNEIQKVLDEIARIEKIVWEHK